MAKVTKMFDQKSVDFEQTSIDMLEDEFDVTIETAMEPSNENGVYTQTFFSNDDVEYTVTVTKDKSQITIEK